MPVGAAQGSHCCMQTVHKEVYALTEMPFLEEVWQDGQLDSVQCSTVNWEDADTCDLGRKEENTQELKVASWAVYIRNLCKL